jgi:methylthioribose-1-phosphate isomerase
MFKRTIWPHPSESFAMCVLDQRMLPHRTDVLTLRTVSDVVYAIQDMAVRGAPLIAATAAYGVWFGCREAAMSDAPAETLRDAFALLRAARPTAVNIFGALSSMETALNTCSSIEDQIPLAKALADALVEQDVEDCRLIGVHGLPLFRDLFQHKKEGGPLNILTHCNAGRLGCIEWGTVTAPIYQAAAEGLPLHVWVDETRPRNQGASLTAWELGQAGIPHTVIVDNAGGHLMQHGAVDLLLTGADRVTRCGDVANKIGTYLKALAAKDNSVPFYVALPTTTIDWSLQNGLTDIPIEERSPDEVRYAEGWCDGQRKAVLLTPPDSPARNWGFDVTPSRLVSGFITNLGLVDANESALSSLQKRL